MGGTIPGKRLEELLHERRMTQTGLARRLGVTQAYVSALVRGQKAGSLETWGKIADAMDVDVAELLSSGTERSQVTIGGVPVSGPSEKLAAIVAALQSAGERMDLSHHPAIIERQRPNERHSGIHELLDLVDRGDFEVRYKFALDPAEEVGLRTFGRRGQAVTTADEALELVLRWRGERLGEAPDLTGPEPGVEALLSSPSLVAELGMTEEEQDALRRARCGGLVRTLQGAIRLLDAIRAGTGDDDRDGGHD